MDAKLLELLRKNIPTLLDKWTAEHSSNAWSRSGVFRDLASTMLPLLLDSLQFPGFTELKHLGTRIGRKAYTEGVPLKDILDNTFRLRLVMTRLILNRTRPAGKYTDINDLNAQIDLFCSTCAQAYLQTCTIRAAGQPADNTDTTSALRALLNTFNDGPDFGTLMKKLRKGKEISMRTLAEMLDMARGYVSNIENGKAVPSFKAIARICDLLDPDGANNLVILGIIQRMPEQIRQKLLKTKAER